MTTGPVLAPTRHELAEHVGQRRAQGLQVGLVPTMGALHSGHAGLMRRARAEVGAGPVVVSIFVNPLQFGANEDLARYPRTLDEDLAMCAGEGVDVVFAPSTDEMYPGGQPQVSIEPGPLGSVLEGASRPGHFRGVLTVVAKLFGLVRPDVAVFGEKDYQQLTLIRRMADDLCLGLRVVGAETQREPDGLAMSSRNRYLDDAQRAAALALSRALRAAQQAGRLGPSAARAAAAAQLECEPRVDVDYLVVTNADLGELPARPTAGTTGRVLVAAQVGTTRLIDNMAIELGTADR